MSEGLPLAVSLTWKRGLAMTQPSPDTQEMLESLRECVSQELERKWRIGHYAVIWQDGKPVLMGEDAPAQQHVDTERQAVKR